MCFCLGKKKCWYKSLPSQYLNSPRHFFPLTYAWKCFAWQGFKLTKQSMWRSTPNWLAVSANRYPAGHFMSNQQSLGLQLAQLGRDASAAVSRSHCELLKKKKGSWKDYTALFLFSFFWWVFFRVRLDVWTHKRSMWKLNQLALLENLIPTEWRSTSG